MIRSGVVSELPKLNLSITNASLQRTAANAKRNAIKLITSSKQTKNKWPNFRKASSAPGQPPVDQTGNLKRSIKSRAITNSGANKGIVLYSDAEYAAALEHGKTDRSFNTAPRPFLRPAMEMATRYYVSTELNDIEIVNGVRKI